MAVTVTVNSKTDKNTLLQEATMQSKMIANLSKWLKALLLLSSAGIVLVWWGLSGETFSVPVVAGGVVLILGSILAILLVQKAIVNGRRNVDRIMTLASK